MRRNFLLVACLTLLAGMAVAQNLPRTATPAPVQEAMSLYLQKISEAKQDVHSILIVQHGKVLDARWMSEGKENEPHILNSVSKTFTSTAVGLAVAEGKLKVTDKVISFFPDKLPARPSENLKAMTVHDLLTMTCGHDTDPTGKIRNSKDNDWIRDFLAYPVEHKPGTYFCYNSLGTYMLSAIVQKVTGEKVVDYLYPRLFKPLGIDKPNWLESPAGINCGGWGLYLKTEDMAKMGQLLLKQGKWNGKRLLSKKWIRTASSALVPSRPAGSTPQSVAAMGLTQENNEWLNGYGYQLWRSRHHSYRADGANGQYILVLPDLDAVIAVTAHVGDMQAEINLIWDCFLPALKQTK